MKDNDEWMSLVETAWNHRAQRWADKSENMWEQGSRKEILPFCTTYFPEKSEVLDVGCGSGYSAFRLNELGYAVTGIDLSAEMISLAQKQYPNIDFGQGNVSQLSFRDKQFSGILAINVLEWTETPEDALQELLRVLTDGGYLCIGILGPTAGPRELAFDRLIGKKSIMNTMMPWEFAKLAEHHGFEYVDQLIVHKNWSQNIKGELPMQAQQALSFMTVFLLQKRSEVK